MCTFQCLRRLKKEQLFRNVFVSLFLCALLPLSLFKGRHVSDLSVDGMRQNEKQMLDPYAKAVFPSTHTHTAHFMSRGGWDLRDLGE